MNTTPPAPVPSPKTNFHVHTTWSDGVDGPDAVAQAALAGGFAAIGVSDHVALPAAPPDAPFFVDAARAAAYAADVRATAARFAGRLPVFLGAEADYIPGLADPDRATCAVLAPDYVIGAVHFVVAPDGALVNVAARSGVREAVESRFGGSAEGLVRAYFAAQREMVARFDFDVVAHPDVVRKTNCADPWFDESAPWYREELERTADAIAAAGRLVEVNTAALSHVDAQVDASPSPAFRALLRARGVRFVLASDAHSAGALDRGFDRFAGCEAFVLPPCAAAALNRP